MSTFAVGSSLPAVQPPFTPEQLVRAITAPLEGKSCFIFGAFVLEDPGHSVFAVLRKQGYRRRTYQFLPTHDVFQHPHTNGDYVIGPPTYGSGHLIQELRDQWEVSIFPTSVCTSQCPFDHHNECIKTTETVKKRIILTYPFEVQNLTTGEKKQYCYVKLEDHPYFSPLHVTSAIKRYSLGRANTSNFFVSRREDDTRKYELNAHDEELPEEWRTSPAKEFYDAHVRAANEMFVPYSIFEGVLHISR